MRRVVLSALVASLLVGCSREEPGEPSAGTISDTSIVSSAPTTSEITITTTTISPDETPTTDSQTTTVVTPTTIVPSASPPECDLAAIAADVDTTGLIINDCVGGWMITQFGACTECESVQPYHAEAGVWKAYFPLYINCWYGQGAVYDGQSTEIRNALISLTYIFSGGWDCVTVDQYYQPERAQGQLKFGDIGNRVKTLQTALVALGFLDESLYHQKADGMYGPKTVKAVMNFQYSENLTVDGVAGMQTHAALKLQYPNPINN